VGRRVGRRPVRLDQHEARRIVLLLEEVEPDHARLAPAAGRVDEGGLAERLAMLGKNVDRNVHD
jgi:hypothetical protein